ncbi:F0F1 ATP synthase subunit A [Candidatus Saccharibacteria bacterium]|nr:F0F1 ATP synthase subunit A [Candidatus Saccharibacteria bacterium]
MLNLITKFSAEAGGPAVHITPAELFQINGIPITNSMVYGWISSLVIIILLISIVRKMGIKPSKGLAQFIEIGSDFITNQMTSSLGSRKKALYYAPYFVTFFFFIMLSNWLGLLPGVGEALKIGENPIFRPFTADLNGTLAAATIIMIFVQFFAIKESGLIKHISHYFNGSLKNPLTIFLGIFEMFSELIRVFSLALRLFLNVTIGEVIISVFSYLGSVVAPLTSLPFVLLELAVGALQAYIFVMLSMTYLSVAIKHGAEHEAHDHDVEEATA